MTESPITGGNTSPIRIWCGNSWGYAMKISLTHVLLLVILVLGVVVFFLFARDAATPGAEPTAEGSAEQEEPPTNGLTALPPTDIPTVEPTAESPTEESTAYPCPVATPELFYVDPVTSPTDQLSQMIIVGLGRGETITITTESGTFVAPFDTFPTEIEIALLPDTTHNLTVTGKVREVVQGDCTYGGYILTTTRDRYGDPLVIEQNQP